MLRHPVTAVAYAYQGKSVPAYSYAGNNPITNVDRNGLYFYSTSGAAWAALSQLAQNPSIGSAIETMQRDPDRRFMITDDVPYPYAGGGFTHPYPTGSADTIMDLAYANSQTAQCKSGQPSSYFPQSYNNLLAHELGHAFGLAYSSQSNEADNVAVQWENAVRNESGMDPRGYPHDPPVCPGCR
jgi:hypothetical protein